MKKSELSAIGGDVPTNGAAQAIDLSKPYVVNVRLCGTADILFHRWNCESVDEKAKAAKGSKAKKTDDVESYVWRDHESNICIPGEYVRQSIIMAAKFRQDPRSPRKSAMDLYKAAILSLTTLAPVLVETAEGSSGEQGQDRECHGVPRSGKAGCGKVSTTKWDYLDRRRVTVQRSGVTRVRPAMLSGWEADFQLMVNLPEYVRPEDLHDVLTNAGRLVGLGDFRPTYGRFVIVSYDIGFES